MATTADPQSGLREQLLAGPWWRQGARWVVSRGAPELRPGTCAMAVELARAAGYHTLEVPPAPAGFPNFGAVMCLADALRPVIAEQAPELLVTIRSLLSDPAVQGSLQGARQAADVSPSSPDATTAAGRVAETIVFAITRRISRESHHAATRVDGLAGALLEAGRRCPALQGGVALVVPDLDRWDRPSLRCLHRLVQLSGEGDRVLVAAFATLGGRPDRTSPETTDVPTRVAWARNRFLQRLAQRGSCTVVAVGPDRPAAERWEGAPLPGSDRDLLIEVGLALSYQNYERVYLACRALLERSTDADMLAQAHRLLGVASAQLQDFETATADLERALELSRRPAFRAHVRYLLGLLATKRTNDLGLAQERYAHGLRELEAIDADTAEKRVERAWLMNGQALVLTLEAKEEASPERREAMLRDSLRTELEAYELVRDRREPAATYLRHNLLSNITFLLEIKRDFAQAVEFWQRAFERYLAADHPPFLVAFNARLGLLQLKTGRAAEAVEALDTARQLCRRLEDAYYEERICVAQGYTAYQLGDLERAEAAFRDGARLAAELSQAGNYGEHVSGVLLCLARRGDRDGVREVVEHARAAPPDAEWARAIAGLDAEAPDLAAALREAGIRLPFPSPKLPAYIPDVDLEGTPGRDLNKYLVS
jgi:tetratricopeptide (TPR) repeat protein